jgi:hypothetical protein
MSDKYPGGFVTAGAPAGFSVALNGSSDYLTWTGSSIATSQFSFECWFYCTGNIASDKTLLGIANTSGLNVRIPSATTISLDNYGVAAYTFTVPTMSANTWYHVAAVRGASNVCTIFLNGVRSSTGTQTLADNFGSSSSIGYLNSASNLFFTGYISNARLIVGSTPYDPTATTINVPTQLFPTADTKLLTCQSPTIIDNSNSPFTITAVSGAKVSNFTPFTGYTGFNPALGAAAGGVWTLDEAAYYQQNRLWPIYDPYFNQTTLMLHGNGANTAQNNTFLDSSSNNFTVTRQGNTTQGTFTPFSQAGWGNFFNGTSYLIVNNATNQLAFLNTADWQIEMWCYPNSLPGAGDNVLYDGRPNNGPYPMIAVRGVSAGAPQKAIYYTNTATQIVSDTIVPLGAWTHIMVSRVSNVTRMFINGVVQAQTYADTTNYLNDSTHPQLGRNAVSNVEFWNGHISNVRVLKGSGTSTSFTPSTAPLTNTPNTVLLTCQSNRFVDNSVNNFSITQGGTAGPATQAFSPFVPAYSTPTTYSNTFDGTGDYLTFGDTSTACAFPAGTDFTIECWMYNKTTTSQGTLWSTSSAISASESLRIWLGDNTNTLVVWSTYTVKITSSAVFQNNVWYHVAVVRNGTTLTLYQNGINVGSVSNNQSFTSDNFTIANTGGSGGPYPMNGVVSNLRVVKGTALYTANFTPPTSPLTAISGTQILTCQSSTFIDNSTNNFAVSATGNVQPILGVPFSSSSVVVDNTTLNAAYTPALIGGSMYNAAAGDGLQFLTSSTQFGVAGNFTIEQWIYPTATASNYNAVWGFNDSMSTNNPSVSLFYNSSYNLFWLNDGGGGNGFDTGAGINIVPYQWNHVAIARSGSSIRCWTNGVLRISDWGNGAMNANKRFLFVATDRALTETTPGYMSGFRFVNGTALYASSANFSPPVLPPTNIANTAALTNFTNGAIFDDTAKNVLQTVGTAQISTAQSKWGGSSIYFANGGTDYLINPYVNNPNFTFGGDFTVELWVYPTSTPDTYNCIIGNFSESGTTYGWNLMLTSGGLVHVNVAGTSNNSAQTVPLNTWTHLAIARWGSTVYIFVNGKRDTTTLNTSALAYNPVYPLRIGRQVDTTPRYFFGYMDDIRITNGVARYKANFTPPTSQLQNQ